jgi:Flp pilus assembly protein TadB
MLRHNILSNMSNIAALYAFERGIIGMKINMLGMPGHLSNQFKQNLMEMENQKKKKQSHQATVDDDSWCQVEPTQQKKTKNKVLAGISKKSHQKLGIPALKL